MPRCLYEWRRDVERHVARHLQDAASVALPTGMLPVGTRDKIFQEPLITHVHTVMYNYVRYPTAGGVTLAWLAEVNDDPYVGVTDFLNVLDTISFRMALGRYANWICLCLAGLFKRTVEASSHGNLICTGGSAASAVA